MTGERDGQPRLRLAPDRARIGTNALFVTPPDAVAMAFGPGSLARHVQAARAAAVLHDVVALPELALDIDDADDLLAFRRRLMEAGMSDQLAALDDIFREHAH
jgi:2-phospho-L-lactate guanylyltransferase